MAQSKKPTKPKQIRGEKIPDPLNIQAQITRESSSMIERLVKRQQDEKLAKQRALEKNKDWIACVQRLAGTSDGKYFLRGLVEVSGVFTDDDQINPADLILQKGLKRFYLRYVRPNLDKPTTMEIE